ncbi:MAG: Pigment protein [Acidimicrobiales bacterium]|nr:Pigment protein [Acidimicrobiales bacterium]
MSVTGVTPSRTEGSGEIVARAEGVGRRAGARSAEIEAARTLPVDLVAELAAADLFRMWVPAELGGGAVGVAEGLAVIEALGYHDGATAWCVMIGATTGLLAAFLPDEHARRIYEDPAGVTGGFAAPMGRARVVEGGLRVTGRWQWGSGTRHCTWIGGGCLLVGDDGQPAPRADGLIAPFAFFDRADVELLDTWHVAGLKGTGSTDYQVADAFVPEGRWVQLGGEPRVDGPLWRFSFYGMLALGVASVALGLARRAVDELVALAADKRPQGSSRPLAERAPVQAEVAAAEATVRAARALVAETVGATWDDLVAGRPVTDEHKRSLRLAATHATLASAEATSRCYTAAGGAAVYESNPLQRVFRDVHVATQHAMVAPRTFELTGRMRLGLDTDTRQL